MAAQGVTIGNLPSIESPPKGLDKMEIEVDGLSRNINLDTLSDFIGNGGNMPDEDDLTKSEDGVWSLKNRLYSPLENKGKGFKILRDRTSNILTQDDFDSIDTIYLIRYDFKLSSNVINIPSGCILHFDGGSIDDGTINMNNTDIISGNYKIFGDSLIITGLIIGSLNVSWFGAIGDGITNDSVSINKALDIAKINRTVAVFGKNDYYIGDNTIHISTSCRLHLLCDTRFKYSISDNKPALLFTSDTNSNARPKVTSRIIIGHSLYIEGDTNNRKGSGISFNPLSASIQVSNLIINNIKVQYFDDGLNLPESNFYLNKFENLHLTQNNVDINSYVRSNNSGENLFFSFCIIGSSPVGIKSNGSVNGFFFNNCSLDFLQCMYWGNNSGQDKVTFRDCWIEGVNTNQGGDLNVHGLVYGVTYLSGSRPHPNDVNILNCRIVNNAGNTSLGSVSEKLIENTDANITIDNPFISYQNSYGENSYKSDLLYSISDSVNVKVSNCKLYLRAQGNKLLHKSQDLCPISINRFENIDFTTVNPNATTLFGSVRIRGSQGIDSVDSTSGLYLEVKKTESSTSSNIIFEPNCDLLPISSLKNIVALPSISLDECNVSTVGVHYLIRYFTKERKLSSTSSSFINFNYSDGLTAPKTLKDLTGFGFCVPYAVNNYRFYIPEDVPSDAAFFIPTIRLQFTGEGSSIFKFQSFNMIDRMDISKFTFQKYIQDLPTQGASIKGDLLFYKDKYVVYDGVRWVDNAGYSASANKYGTTAQIPVLTISDTGFIYYDTSLLYISKINIQ